jgi:predicted ABC-type ATPase
LILPLDRRPAIVAIAGPNGAGKSTFYELHVAATALRFVNADVIARELTLDPYAAASVAASVRDELLGRRESFAFETVFSDPVGDKLEFLQRAAKAGYNVILCFVGISDSETSDERVAVRVAEGGHDVPSDKIYARFPRVMANLQRALTALPNVWVFDNDDYDRPYRLVAVYESGKQVRRHPPVPKWLNTAGAGARR